MMSQLSNYSNEVRLALSYAQQEARRLGHRLVGAEHLLLGIFKLNSWLVEGLFVSLHVSPTSVSQALDFVMGHGKNASLNEPALSATVRAILAHAAEEATAVDAPLIGLEHVLFAMLAKRDSIVMGVLESFGIYADVARKQLTELLNKGYESLYLSIEYQARYDATPILNQVSHDLTMAALNGALDPVNGREAELERVMQILSRRLKNNPVLIGPAGVGKTAIVEGLALSIVQRRVPENLLNSRVVVLDIGLLSVGTRYRGDLEERLEQILQEMVNTSKIIIVIDELHTLAQTGVAQGSLAVANLFKPMLARGDFQCIGTSTIDAYHKLIEIDPALERRFQTVLVRETTATETLDILRRLRAYYEDFHRIAISDEALLAAVRMSSRYIPGRFQPDKAIDLVDEAASHLCVQRSVIPDNVRQLRAEVAAAQREKDYAIAGYDFPQAAQLLFCERQKRQAMMQAEDDWHCSYQQQERPVLHEQDIAKIVAMWTGIPVVQIAGEEGQRLLNLEYELHRRVVGQHEAVQAVARAVRRSRANVGDSRRPIGAFVFAGPTGVGKTELARALAAALFGDEAAMLKLDMSEFIESHHISRLIGAPPGYIGYEEAGQLTEAVRRRPYSLVLFDEIEKAHPKIFDILLQILEDGCLTDARGQTVDFKHTLIIITSNVGTAQLSRGVMAFTTKRQSSQKSSADAHERMRKLILSALKSIFRPELLNRVDEVLVFHRLEPEHLREIVDLMVAQVKQRLAEQSIDCRVTSAARLMLAEQGYHPEHGARHLRRTVQRLLEDMLAEAILQGTVAPGDSVLVDVIDGALFVSVPTLAKVAASSTRSGEDQMAA